MGRMLLISIGGIIAALAALKLLFVLLGMALGLLWLFLTKLVPLILVGWLVVVLWRRWMAKPAA